VAKANADVIQSFRATMAAPRLAAQFDQTRRQPVGAGASPEVHRRPAGHDGLRDRVLLRQPMAASRTAGHVRVMLRCWGAESMASVVSYMIAERVCIMAGSSTQINWPGRVAVAKKKALRKAASPR